MSQQQQQPQPDDITTATAGHRVQPNTRRSKTSMTTRVPPHEVRLVVDHALTQVEPPMQRAARVAEAPDDQYVTAPQAPGCYRRVRGVRQLGMMRMGIPG